MARTLPRRVELVAIGASLGGLQEVSTLLQHLKPTPAAALVLAQHRSEDPDSGLAILLGRQTAMPVREPNDKEAIEPAVFYLAPPGYHLLVDGRHFSLSADGPVNFSRPSIDVLFESVAESFGPRAAAVVLTGASHDGARGAKAIVDAGGRLAVQDPETAEAPTAIRAAMSQTTPDVVGTTEEIAGWISSWCAAVAEKAEIR